MDGIYLRRNWGGEYENVAILVAIAVNVDGFREVLGAAEGMKEDKASWGSFFQWLRGRGLDGVKLIVGDKCMGMLEAVGAESRAMKLKEAAKKVEDGIEETLTYCDFPSEHWTRIRTNNVIERLNREIRRRTRVVGTFPDGNSALMLSMPDFAMWQVPSGAAKKHEHEALGGGHGRRLYCRLISFSRSLQTILRINLDGTP